MATQGIGPGGEFRVHSGGLDYEIDHDNLKDEDKKVLALRSAQYQKEIQNFTEFLRQKYFFTDIGQLQELSSDLESRAIAEKGKNPGLGVRELHHLELTVGTSKLLLLIKNYY